MSIISLKDKDLKILDRLLELIKKEKIVKTNDINYDLLKTKAREYISDESDLEDASELKEFSYYSLNNYSIDEDLNEDSIFNYMMALSSIAKEVIKNNEIYLKKRKEFDSSKYNSIDLSIIPSMDVYEYVGNNKLSINPSNRSYGLLFE